MLCRLNSVVHIILCLSYVRISSEDDVFMHGVDVFGHKSRNTCKNLSKAHKRKMIHIN